MAKLWQRSSDPKTRLPVVEVELNNLHISKPSVIFLSGIFTTDRQPQHIAEGITEVEAMLKGRAELKTPPDIYALSHKDLGNIFNIAAYNGNPEKACSKAAKRMAAAVILPLVLNKKGKPLEPEKARENLRNITFVAYSAGTVFAQEMYNAALKEMEKAGYRKKDARDILGEVVLISMAPVSKPLEEKERFTTLYIAASNDMAVRLKNRIWRPLHDFFSLDSRDLKIRKLSENSLLITAYIASKLWHWRDEPDGSRTRLEISPLVPKRFHVNSNHELPHYTTGDDEHNAFAKLALNALINAVNRDKQIDVAALLEPVTARNAAEAAAYRDRLKLAKDKGAIAADFTKKAKKTKNKPPPKPPKMKRSA